MKDTDYKVKGSDVSNSFKKTLRHNDGLIFQQLEFTVTGLCNRSCSFCPRTDPKIFKSTTTFLDLEILKKNFFLLAKYEYSGRLSYAGFGEPFTHPKFDKILEISREILPKSVIDIITNADLLKTKLGKRVLENKHFNRLLISAYDGIEQVRKLEKDYSELIEKGKMVIRKRFLYEGDELDLFSSRTGLVDYGDNSVSKTNPCFYPFYNIFVDSNGDIIACCHDWGKKKIFGNIYKESILDIWFSKEYKVFRKLMFQKPRAIEPCNNCDVDGTLYGAEAFSDWKEKKW